MKPIKDTRPCPLDLNQSQYKVTMGSKRPHFSVSKDAAEYNIALLGALGVGKSALTVKYITKRFIMEYDPTLEDTYTKTEAHDGQEVTIRIMDTYHTEEEDRELDPDRYLKWAHGFMVVYSITSRATYDAARNYLDLLVQHQRDLGREVPVALVGNKMDLERYRTVSRRCGETLAGEYDCLFHETSAAEDYDSVEIVFHDLLHDVVRSCERPLTLAPLFISEDKSGATHQMSTNGVTPVQQSPLRRAKSPKTSDSIKVKQKEEKDPKILQRRTVSTFKLFNKSFKIFN